MDNDEYRPGRVRFVGGREDSTIELRNTHSRCLLRANDVRKTRQDGSKRTVLMSNAAADSRNLAAATS